MVDVLAGRALPGHDGHVTQTPPKPSPDATAPSPEAGRPGDALRAEGTTRAAGPGPESVAAPRGRDARDRPSPRLRLVGAAVAVVASGVALAVIWASRLTVGRSVYVSELGSGAFPTTDAFNAALLLLGLGGAGAAVAVLGQRSVARGLRLGSVTASLAVSAVCFALASRVTCTPGCPVPFSDGATTQDVVHVAVAVLGFAAAVWAMLQTATGTVPTVARRTAVTAAVLVALTSATGGLLSIAGVRVDVGADLELTATTIAVLWLVVHAAGSGLAGRSRTAPHRSTTG